MIDDEDDAAALPETDPTGNKLALDQQLVDEIRQSHNKSREGIIEVAQKAHQLRMQYLREDGKRYAPEFENWWRVYNLKGIFGERSNFTKYANAGQALETADIRGHLDRLPITLRALDLICHMSLEEIKLCLENRYTRSAVGAKPKAPNTPSPVIHPNATYQELSRWLNRWRKPPANEAPTYDTLTLDEFAEIETKVMKVLKPYDGYELADDIKELLRVNQKRLKRAEAELAKKKP